ncbi:13261_t:CDS:2, partial [Cetraspora pellucida]
MTAMPIGFENPVSNQALLWAQQPFQQFQQPFQSGLGSGSFSDNLRQYVPDKFPSELVSTKEDTSPVQVFERETRMDKTGVRQ